MSILCSSKWEQIELAFSDQKSPSLGNCEGNGEKKSSLATTTIRRSAGWKGKWELVTNFTGSFTQTANQGIFGLFTKDFYYQVRTFIVGRWRQLNTLLFYLHWFWWLFCSFWLFFKQFKAKNCTLLWYFFSFLVCVFWLYFALLMYLRCILMYFAPFDVFCSIWCILLFWCIFHFLCILLYLLYFSWFWIMSIQFLEQILTVEKDTFAYFSNFFSSTSRLKNAKLPDFDKRECNLLRACLHPSLVLLPY